MKSFPYTPKSITQHNIASINIGIWLSLKQAFSTSINDFSSNNTHYQESLKTMNCSCHKKESRHTHTHIYIYHQHEDYDDLYVKYQKTITCVGEATDYQQFQKIGNAKMFNETN